MADENKNGRGKDRVEQGRPRKLTEKGIEERLQRFIALRRRTLGTLTSRMKEIEALMSAKNLENVKDMMESEFAQSLNEFNSLNNEVGNLLSEDEKMLDQDNWFVPKMEVIKDFMKITKRWIADEHEYTMKESMQLEEQHVIDEQQDAILPSDSVSQVRVCRAVKDHLRGSRVSGTSCVSSTRARQEAEHAALLERAAALRKRQELEFEAARIKAEKEELELETALAESQAKLKVLREYERSEDGSSCHSSAWKSLSGKMNKERDAMMLQQQAHVNVHVPTQVQHSRIPQQPQPASNQSPRAQTSRGDDIFTVIQKQNVITELLVKQQQLSQLPKKDIPVFKGDALQYKSFIRAFEHAIEQKTDNDQDKLYFLEQYTDGEPQELVRSCVHMTPSKGYHEAKQLLHKHYGDELRIASAYIDKALKWPQVKSDDRTALNAYAMFLIGCCNTMEDIEFLEEMDNPTNLRTVISKLPYKMKERWRAEAFELKERRGRRARFADLVNFVDRQAKIAMDPLFGNISDSRTTAPGKMDQRENRPARKEVRGSSFATNVAAESKMSQKIHIKPANTSTTVNAFDKPCLYCQQSHTLASCSMIKGRPHKERLDFLKSKGLCFGCLVPGHLSTFCKRKLECKECALKHPDILHKVKDEGSVSVPVKKDGAQIKEVPCAEAPISQESCGFTGAGEADCVLSIVPIKIKSKNSDKHIKTYAFLDPGSTATFCTEDLQRKLNVKGKPTRILLSTMGQDEPGERKLVNSFVISDLEVCGLESNVFIELPKVFTHSSIPVHAGNIPKQKDVQMWPYLHEVSLPEIDAEVGLLIGANCSRALEPWRIINGQAGGPYAVKTAIGWVVNGPIRKDLNETENEPRPFSVNKISLMEIERLLVQQYNADFPERSYDDKKEMSQEDKIFMRCVEKTSILENGHYIIGLPFRNEKLQMPNNRCVAEQRIAFLLRKFKRNAEFFEDYKGFMETIIGKGYAVQVPTHQLNRDDKRVFYIPHHGVYHPKKQKLRVVFDCTSSFQGRCLNSELLQGPDLTSTLVGVLLRFREESVAVMADIESMFYQVRVPEHDADLLRFLWWPNGRLDEPMAEFRMTVHLFGANSSPSVASYALRRTAEDHRSVTSPCAVQTVLNNFYVDDCLKSVATDEDAITLVNDLRALCNSGGFTLTKWMSNSRKVLLSIPEEHRASKMKDLDLRHDALPVERTLGVQWDTEMDTFTYSMKLQDKPMTRRGILSVINSIYDPLGFLAPVILPAKLLLKELCKEQLGWDENIGERHAEDWRRWVKDVTHLTNFHVSRCLKPTKFGCSTAAQLHHFSDASEYAYGTVSYLLLENEQGEKHCAFLMGKSRVAPLKRVTIPRLELTAAVIAVKVDKMLHQELQVPLQQSVFWTDSTTVLRYVFSEAARFKTFVANRISLIREATKQSQWKYVRTDENPADQASRGLKAKSLVQGGTWMSGPKFLPNENDWPEQPVLWKESLDEDPEVKNSVTVNTVKVEESTEPMSQLIGYYSDWNKLKRSVAWIVKIKDALWKWKEESKEASRAIDQTEKDTGKRRLELERHMKKFKATSGNKSLTLEDLDTAEAEIIRFSQRQHFGEEIKVLQKGNNLSRSSALFRLNPTLQDGTLRVGGRLNKSAMPENAKHPAILSKHSKVATLILRDIHQRTGHCGRSYVLAQLRCRYWIPQANNAIRKIINKCTVCRRMTGKAGEQMMADLPEDRLLPDQPPFTNTGVDYFGPFEVKRGRSSVKRYGVMFTCLSLRAVHIEVADSLDTDSCINAIRRFVCRRGQVNTLRSDNGTNFVAAERELRGAIQQLDNDKIERAFHPKGIKWIFNSPAASHQGGVWERQIRSARRILNSLVKEQAMNDDCLHTIMCEVESIINGRPLTSVSDDANDIEPLTPNHLLLLKSQPIMPPGTFCKDDMYARRRWKQVQYLADLFWSRWTREYLPLLQERQKWLKPRRNFMMGDVVLLVDSSSPRNSWVMGKVVETMPDSSGMVRRVKLKTMTNTLERPVNKLCLLKEVM
ncbi:uncharacterized protein LOC143484479 [Brachyhypopomus gauderio]|uniref:uncharacterized protein LOC143484479 n=1 Tax=Brachyhypopomus gauderio TaxID=698409 RepID=UPI004041DFCC